MSKPAIELKGSTFTLPVIQLNNTDPDLIKSALTTKIEQAPNLLKNASVVVNISELGDNINYFAIYNAIISTGLNVVGISGCNEIQKQNVTSLGMFVLSEGKSQKQLVKSSQQKQHTAELSELTSTPIKPEPTYDNTFTQLSPIIITTPVRSGQQIYARNRDLIVMATVSHGAEIISDGNIHVYSKMRGKIIAGANNNPTANIFCTQLEAELVSIAGHYWLSDNIPFDFYGKSVRICLTENTLHINSLHID